MRFTAAVLLCGLAVVSCVRRGPPPVEGSGGPGPVVAPASGDPLSTAFAARDTDLGARGFRVMSSAVRGQLSVGAMTSYPVEAQAGLCYVALALTADAQADFDLFVYDAEGAEVSRHVAPASASSAWVGFCPSRAGRHSVHVHAYAGGGDYLFAAYQGSAPPLGLDAVFAVSASSGTGTGPATPSDPAAASRVAARDAELSRDGYARAGAASTATLSRRQSTRVTGQLENGRCYAFVAMPGAGGQDVDVALFSPGGQRLARDDSRSATAILRHCPQVAGRYSLEVALADGSGPVWIASYVRGNAPPTAIFSFDAPAASPSQAVPASVDAARHVVDHELHARGYTADPTPAIGTLADAAVQSHELSLTGGHCYAVSAAGDSPMSSIELAIFDRASEMARDAAGHSWAIARICPARNVTVRVEVRAGAGGGAYELRQWSWPHSAQGPFGLQGAIFVRLSEATRLLSHDGLEPTTVPTVADARQGTPVRADLQLEPGACYAIVAAGGPDVREVELSLLSGTNVLATAASHEPVAIVRRCIEAQGRYRLELRAARGAGQVLHQVFSTAPAQPAP